MLIGKVAKQNELQQTTHITQLWEVHGIAFNYKWLLHFFQTRSDTYYVKRGG